MKSPSIRVFLIILLLASGIGLFAQQSLMKNLEMISDSEKSAYQKLNAPHEQLIVNNYDLKYHRFFLFADPSKTYISGSVTSYFLATQAGMSSIQFELYATMSADSAFHRGVKKNVTHTGNVITIPLGGITPQGTLDSVTVYYHGNPTTSGFGSFGNQLHAGAYAMWTLSEPYGASDWWPSKNDLTDKIDSVDMYVVTPKGNHVAGNGVLLSETPYGTNSVLARWKTTYPIVSYLIAIAATNYARFSDYYISGGDSLEILNYVYPEDSASLRANAASVLPSMALFEKLFTPYPFWKEKYGHAQFGWGGGMEHQTMTFLGKGAFNVEIIAHELAHQWFGDMITCGSWQDIWLNEGFATYCAGLVYEDTSPGNYWPTWKNNQITFVCNQTGGSVFCDDTTSVNRIFSSRLSYSKGAMLLHMMRWVMGDDKFFAGIRNYLNDPKLKHGFARTPDFKAHMEAVSGLNLTGFLADWYTGQGYPTYTIHVGKQQPDKSATVSIYQTQSHSSVSFFEMPVPVQFLGAGKDTIIVLNHTFSGQVFTVNPGFAFQSVKFDPKQWIVSKSNKLTVGITDLPAGKELVLLPNPASNFLHINHNLGMIDPPVVLSLDGKPMALPVNMQNDTRIEMDIQSLRPGMYIMLIKYQDQSVVRKFVVNR